MSTTTATATEQFLTEMTGRRIDSTMSTCIFQPNGRGAVILGFDRELGLGVARSEQGYNVAFRPVANTVRFVASRNCSEVRVERFNIETIVIGGVIFAGLGPKLSSTGVWKTSASAVGE